MHGMHGTNVAKKIKKLQLSAGKSLPLRLINIGEKAPARPACLVCAATAERHYYNDIYNVIYKIRCNMESAHPKSACFPIAVNPLFYLHAGAVCRSMVFSSFAPIVNKA